MEREGKWGWNEPEGGLVQVLQEDDRCKPKIARIAIALDSLDSRTHALARARTHTHTCAHVRSQLRAVAILLANGVYPKVFQVQQKKYDTHAGQLGSINKLVPGLKTALYTFVRTADTCGFLDQILVRRPAPIWSRGSRCGCLRPLLRLSIITIAMFIRNAHEMWVFARLQLQFFSTHLTAIAS